MRRLFPTAVVLIGIACLVPGVITVARADDAAERAEINSNVDAALSELHAGVPGSQEIEKQAYGVLVFPAIYKAGFIIGAEHGKGALRVHGKSVGYYSTSGASFGLLAGAEKRSMALMFMTQDALEHFQTSSGWDVGADASVAIVQVGAAGSLDASQLKKQPVVAFVFGTSGLMGNLSLGGTKVSKLDLPADTASGSSAPKQ